MKKSLFISTFALLLGLGAWLASREGFSNESVEDTVPSLAAPYESAQEIRNIWPYSASENTALGKFHNGLDFIVEKDRTPFYAIADGKVEMVELFHNDRNSMDQINIYIAIDSTYGYGMGFEMFGTQKNLGEEQMAELFIEKGQKVKKGDLIGYLLKRGDGAHVHISVKKEGEDFCFFPLFSEEVQKELEPKLMNTSAGPKQACYE